MESPALNRLRLIGLMVLIIAMLLLWLPLQGWQLKYDEAIASTVAIGIGLLLIAEIGPAIKSIRAGGVEVEFAESVGNKLASLEARVGTLEQRRPDGGRPGFAKTSEKKPPALAKKQQHDDDPWKGRFGGKAENKGFRLLASYRTVSRNWVEIVLRVDAVGTTVADGTVVEFYLHDSFDPDVLPVTFRNGSAEASVISSGGFTVGAWIPSTETELELDLARARGAPRIVRDN